MTAAIAIRDLLHRFGDGGFTLQVSAFDVAASEHVAVIGPSGCGKSTLLNVIAGILLPDQGSVRVGGVEWRSLSEGARRARRIREIGLVFQEFELLDHLSVRENVLLPRFVSSALGNDAALESRATALLEASGIAAQSRKRPRQLSHGERQRVALCRALIAAPSVVLADEPTGNLDPENARRALGILRAQARETASTLVLVTHDHALLDDFDRVVDLHDLSRGRSRGEDAAAGGID